MWAKQNEEFEEKNSAKSVDIIENPPNKRDMDNII